MNRNDPGAKLLTIALVAAVAFLLLPYLSGLIGAAILFVVARPIRHWLDPSRKHRTAAFATIFLLFVALVLPSAWLIAALVAQIPDAIEALQRSNGVQSVMTMRMGGVELGSRIGDASSAIVAWSSRQTMAAVTSMLNATLNLVIAMFGAYYLLLSNETLWARFKTVLPFHDATSELLRRRFHRVTEAMLLGVVLTCAAQGLLVGLAFWLVRLSQPLLWGAVTAVVAMLPMFGSSIVWLPGVLVLISEHRYPEAALLGGLGLVIVSNVDNALRMVVYKRVSQIHPMITLVGAFAGARAFGFAGLLIGPLLVSYAIELMRVYRASHHPPELDVTEAAA